MTLQSREIINRTILDALAEVGVAVLNEPSASAHPRRYLIVRDDLHSSVWVYCWMLTHGGRPSLPNEYRIQMTSVASPLSINPNGYTVLLGYDRDRRVFAGYDLTRHTTFTSGSPSVQVQLNTLNLALQNGMAFETKSNNEIVIGVRSDLLFFYCLNAIELHLLGEDATAIEAATRASALQSIELEDFTNLPERRRTVIQETTRWSRSASFRRQVLSAYDNRCAVTRRQLRLVEAAHIMPVAAGARSIDDVRNGIALAPTYHRAFDAGLIYLDEGMKMRLNPPLVDALRGMDLSGGIDEFESSLGLVHLPANPVQRPDPYFIRIANEYRGIQ